MGRSRTNYGDYAIVPSLEISKSTTLSGFTTYDSLKISFDTDVYEGSNYSLNFSKSQSFEALFGHQVHGEL